MPPARRKRGARGGPRPGAGAKPSDQPKRIQRGLRWDPALLEQLDAWAARHGLDFTATVHEGARRLLRAPCDLLGPHEGEVTAHTVGGEVLLLCERHALTRAQGDGAVARDCRCCPCCRQCPCSGVMAGGMCDDLACSHEERDLMDDDNEEEDDGL